MSHGIILSDKDLDEEITYDSRKLRPQVALEKPSPHLDIITLPPGTALATDVGNGYYAEEVLFSIKHELPYTPKPLVYFFVSSTGNYAIGKYLYQFGAFDDYIGYRVTATEFQIVHILDDRGLNVGVTSTAPNFGNVRIKYLIFSNPINDFTNEAIDT